MTGNVHTLIILFALGVIGLSSSEIWLLARVPDSTVAKYVPLASGLTLVLRNEAHDTSVKVSTRQGLNNAKVER
jgi:hypothetical protein